VFVSNKLYPSAEHISGISSGRAPSINGTILAIALYALESYRSLRKSSFSARKFDSDLLEE
jgi:hypothetical protein